MTSLTGGYNHDVQKKSINTHGNNVFLLKIISQ